MPPPPSQKAVTRTPLSIDDVAIDFSAVKPSAATAASAAAPTPGAAPAVNHGLLAFMQQQQVDERQRVSDVRAFDPGLQSIAQRPRSVAGVAANRRKKVFGGQPFVPPSALASNVKEEATTAASTRKTEEVRAAHDATPLVQANSDPTAAQDAVDFLISAQQKQQQHCSPSDLQQRRQAYTQELRSFCQRGRASARSASPSASTPSEGPPAAFPSTSTSHTNSLLTQLFAEGVPDIEPWDRWMFAMPRYGDSKHLIVNPLSATQKQIRDAHLNLLHHPVIPDTHYTRHYQYRDLEKPIIQTEYKTKEELRAERRERLKAKQAKNKQERAAAASAAGTLQEGNGSSGGSLLVSSAASRLMHDRLSTKSLALHLFASSVLNPLAADTEVLQQYELRNLEHQRRNHERHVAALPQQIRKRARDQQRYATENPVLRAYRIFPIYAAAHLGKLRHYANDNLLRGFVLYVADCDAVVVLAGGGKAARHLDYWILNKMEWAHPDTRATRLVTVPLMDAETFSFHLPKAQQGGGGRVYKQGKVMEGASAAVGAADKTADSTTATTAATEPVFINVVPSVEEGERFLRQLPAPSSPWVDLSAIWRTAFLHDGLQTR
ncbi:hypothetical protein ABL78_4800 [Leptomonas seymouri]|uniref:Small nuclear ribonucleoprotein Prp3 C-terminal domain-containing protein n=1 Tax=Leptomonas seymouri TaxID=5684 RepID=A0A0N1HXQ4_LEPSE|nr:hypothetical protein ABL78_4800 [Leptomonas seymouri]|eukprot:KPI86145.1 hypothetical protein ABL78_4800 [Leptomonas seymouri]